MHLSAVRRGILYLSVLIAAVFALPLAAATPAAKPTAASLVKKPAPPKAKSYAAPTVAKKIAKSGIRLYQAAPAFTPAIELELITRTTLAMLHASLDAYARLDDSHCSGLFAGVVLGDSLLDRLLSGILDFAIERCLHVESPALESGRTFLFVVTQGGALLELR